MTSKSVEWHLKFDALRTNIRIAIAAWFVLATVTLPTYVLAHPVLVNTPETIKSGATFVVPAGWSLLSNQKFFLIVAPEPDTHVTVVQLMAKDADAAVAAAWAIYQPDSHRALRHGQVPVGGGAGRR